MKHMETPLFILFDSRDLMSNSYDFLPYNSYDVSLDNLVFNHQLAKYPLIDIFIYSYHLSVDYIMIL